MYLRAGEPGDARGRHICKRLVAPGCTKVLDGDTVTSDVRHNFFLDGRDELVTNPSRTPSQLQTDRRSIRVKSLVS